MCDPATALAGASLAAGALSAVTQYQSGRQAAAVASANAESAQAQAQDSINRGNAAADEARRRNRQALGTQLATAGANGADLASGSVVDIFGDTAQFGELDALTTVNNAQREAYGYEVQASNYKAEASAAKQQGNVGAFSTLLTTPLQAYGAYKMGGGDWNPFGQKAAPISAARR
ncbi:MULTISPECIES: virion core protein, T7 gp14 family [Pseudescherichia]|uniref:virion core protein, T7 gp14 family n=1 Tax=Pseudescherichia TaxID=2055880 RepID=UPI00301C17B2